MRKSRLHILLNISATLFSAVLILAVLYLPHGNRAEPSVPEAGAFEFQDLAGSFARFGACTIASEYDDEVQKLIEDGTNWFKDKLCGTGSSIPVIGPIVGALCNGGTASGEESNFVPTHTKLDDPRATQLELDTQANCAKKELLKFVSNNIISKIVEDSGFVTNYRDLLLNSGLTAENDFLAQLSRSGICPQNRSIIFTLMGGVDAGWTSSDNSTNSIVRCSLAEVLDLENGGLEAYQEDFRAGGWDVWLEQIRPANTLAGQYSQAQETRSALVKIAVDAQKTEAVSSDGFNPMKTRECLESITLPLPSGDGTTEVCTRYKETIETPGSLLSDQVERAAGISLDDLRGADTYYELLYEAISNVGDWLIGRIFDNGLSDFDGTRNSQPSPTPDPTPSPTPDPTPDPTPTPGAFSSELRLNPYPVAAIGDAVNVRLTIGGGVPNATYQYFVSFGPGGPGSSQGPLPTNANGFADSTVVVKTWNSEGAYPVVATLSLNGQTVATLTKTQIIVDPSEGDPDPDPGGGGGGTTTIPPENSSIAAPSSVAVSSGPNEIFTDGTTVTYTLSAEANPGEEIFFWDGGVGGYVNFNRTATVNSQGVASITSSRILPNYCNQISSSSSQVISVYAARLNSAGTLRSPWITATKPITLTIPQCS